MSCNVSEVMVVGLAALLGTTLPILPLQILFLNLVTDVFPALALGFGEGDEHVMDRPPRNPREPVVTRRHWAGITAHGVLLAVVTLLAAQWLGFAAAAARGWPQRLPPRWWWPAGSPGS